MSTRDAGQVRGFPNTSQLSRTQFNQATLETVGSSRAGLDVIANTFFQLVASDTAETGTTTSAIVATSHSARGGDFIVFTSGSLDKQVFTVLSVTANGITLAQNTSVAASNGDGFDILRLSYPRVNSSGAVATTVSSGSITADTELPSAAALADNASNPTAPAVGAFGMVWDGSTWDRLPGTSADGALVNLGANNDVTATGAAAHDAAVSGNPILIAGRADTSEVSAVSDGDVADVFVDTVGRVIIQPFAVPGQRFEYHAGLSGSGDQTLLAADANYKYCVTGFYVTKNDTTTASTYNLRSGGGGTEIYQIVANAAVNWRQGNEMTIPACTAVNTALVINSSATVGYSVLVQGYKSAA